jgi:sigma-E factor negative regulatory protein RseA
MSDEACDLELIAMMSDPSLDPERLRHELSAVADGEADPAQLRRACDAWQTDARLRADWHAWSVIGDVMRSDDLAASADHDVEFLASLRAQLSREPVVLAPGSKPGSGSRESSGPRPPADLASRQRVWGGSAAVAAACLVAVGVGLLIRNGPDLGNQASALQAQATIPSRPGPDAVQSVPVTSAATVAPESMEPAEAQLVRNPELDRYLAAHRQFAQGPALAAPGGLRQVAVTPDGR